MNIHLNLLTYIIAVMLLSCSWAYSPVGHAQNNKPRLPIPGGKAVGPTANTNPPPAPGNPRAGNAAASQTPPSRPALSSANNKAASNQISEPSAGLKSADGKTTFAEANPEDITNENFPNLIESFDYPNADIAEIVKAISKLTGKNFILDNKVSGKISIIAPSQITVAEAYKAFLTALALNGFTVVPSGSFLKIRNIQNATKENIDTYSGAYFPNADQLITRIIKLKYINAEEIQKTLRPLVNTQGDITFYSPTNSLFVTDLGSNVERISTLINQIDVPGFEEKLVAIRIKYARSKDIADLIDQIINKGDKKTNQFGSGIPRFRAANQSSQSSGSGAANYSLVIPDSRTNSIIVVGNDAGIARIRELVRKLDFRIRPEDGGGVYVYRVRYGDAEKIANVLNGIATESNKTKTQTATPTGTPPVSATGAPVAPSEAIFGGDVKVSADKDNNSLIVVASKQDYEVVRSILSKVDLARDQVFVKAVILEMSVDDTNSWGINYYKFDKDSSGVGRAGFSGGNLASLLNPINDSGMILGFGKGDSVSINGPDGKSVTVPSFLALVNFIKSNTNSNILSTPQISALDNEEAEIEVGENVPVSPTSNSTATGTTAGVQREDLTLKFKITPHISPDTDSVRLKIDQKIRQLSEGNVGADSLGKIAVKYSTRSVSTNIVVNSNDTAVIGGLMEDKTTITEIKVPVLGDLPIIGWLFKTKKNQKAKKNLIIFITPKIIRDTNDNNELLNAKFDERIEYIQKYMKGQDPHGSEIDKLPRQARTIEQDLDTNDSEEFVPDNGEPLEPIQEGPTENNSPTTEPGFEYADPGQYEEGE